MYSIVFKKKIKLTLKYPSPLCLQRNYTICHIMSPSVVKSSVVNIYSLTKYLTVLS